MKDFKLYIEKGTTALAGYELGEKMFENQIKDRIDLEDNISITIPEQIKAVSSSWVQGFFNELIKNYGYENFDKKVKVYGNEKVIKTIYQNLL